MSETFARNSLLGVVSGLATALSNFGTSVILARLLGVDGFGTVMFAMWMVVLGAAVADLGSATSLSRYLPELQGRGQEALIGHLASRLFRPFALVVVFLCASLVGYGAWRWQLAGEPPLLLDAARPRENPLFWVVTAAALALQALSLFHYGYLRGLQRFGEIAKLTLVCLAIQLVAVTIGSLACGPLGALAGYCAGFLLPALKAFRHLRAVEPIPTDLAQRVRRYALFAWAGNFATVILYSRIEVFFLERSWGTDAVGLFAVGVTLANIAAQGPMLLTSGFLPHFSASYGRGDRDSIQRLYASGTRVMAFLVLPACFGLAAVLPSLIPLLYGAQFDRAITASVILALSSASGIVYVGNQLALGCDRSDLGFASTLIGAVLLVAGCAAAVPVYGVMGAALVRVGVQLVLVLTNFWLIRSRLGYRAPIGDMVRILVAASICGISAAAVASSISGPLSLAGAIPAGIVTYWLAVRLLNALPADDIERLRSLLRPLPTLVVSPFDRALMLLSRHSSRGAAS
ncbi:lipopolysaccharide biosynthesis protein [Methylobacterium oxalidis]|uniref:lipopolysaccharide biosynthesis protein n=1 Tax=Methylobacterium oxalidis TaxID=944322 RepID=UPI0033157F38